MRVAALVFIAATGGLLSACGSSSPNSDDATLADTPPATSRQVVNILAPGQSGFVSTDGQAAGSATGNPGDFGEHLDDQRLMYWSSEFKAGEFADVSDMTPITPRDGVRIYRDDFGVPIIYGDTAFDVGFGVGFATNEDRLFLNDAARRLAKGTLAEITGSATVPADIQGRVLGYTEAEYQAFFDAIPEDGQQLVMGYVAGANAWVDEVMSNPSLLPIEYTLLTTTPAPFVMSDVLASGVLITRSVASEGGNEFDNVQTLRELETIHGDAATARQVFLNANWIDDTAAAVSVPPSEGTFSNISTPVAQRAAAFEAMADFADGLPLALATGDGTGDAPEPIPGVGVLKPTAANPAQAKVAQQLVQRIKRTFSKNGGASYMAVVAPERSTTGQAMLINGPQLGYGYPTQLHEMEIHGAGFDARGSSAPNLPVIGIGYGERTVWGLTTGNSKTIDSFIETLDPSDPNRYQHNGQTLDMDCRDEVVNYRLAMEGVPAGPASFSETVEVCRTVHGPVVARSNADNLARSVQYAMFFREIDTIVGVLDWMRVDTFSEFSAAMARVTWNENTMYADADGNIAYWHPGLHPRRRSGGDQRLPLPGTGEFDHLGTLAFSEVPQVANPQQGWLANWNNKPALGWGEGVGGNALSLPAGNAQRVTNWQELLAADSQVSFAELLDMDRLVGLVDPRAQLYLPIFTALRNNNTTLTQRQQDLLDVIIGWDRLHHREDLDIEDEEATDTPGATVFDVYVRALRSELLADDLPAAFFNRLSAVGNHEYDAPAMDNLVARVLDPSSSNLTPNFDFADGATTDAILIAALDAADAQLQEDFGTTDMDDNVVPEMNIDNYRRVHHRDEICSLTSGATGPCITMPHQDRGSWIHAVSFE